MKSTAIAAFGITLLVTAAYGADIQPMRGSALISDLTVSPNDSPLVRAAKLVAADRARMTIHSTTVIDNTNLRAMAGRVSFATTEQPALPSGQPIGRTPVSPYAQQQQQQYVPPNLSPVLAPTSPFQLPPPPPTSSPTPYRPQP